MRLLIKFVRYLVEVVAGGVIVAIALTTANQTWYQLSTPQIHGVAALALVLFVGGFYLYAWLTRRL